MPRAGWRKRRYRFGPIAESLIQTIGDVAAKTICKGSTRDRHKVADPAQADSLKTGDGIVLQSKSSDRKHCKNVLCLSFANGGPTAALIAGVTGSCPGCPRGVGNGGISSESEAVEAVDDIAHQGFFAAEQVGATGNV